MARKPDLDDLSSVAGLSEREASERLARDGFNELPAEKKRSFLAIAFSVLKEPMLLLLIASGGLYMILGDIREALMLLGFVFVVIGITFYQEHKTERALEALRDLSSPRALVIREGKPRKIMSRELVAGDVIVISEGDRVPADGIVIACNNLTLEESLLTGESAPVHKEETEDPSIAMETPGGDNTPFVFSGTLVVGGLGMVQVAGTGARTEFGKIGRSLQTIESEESLIQRETRKVVRNLALAGLCLCVTMALIYGLTVGDWLEGFLASITLAMAILPEEFPVVLTVFLALGAWRISQSHVLTRRMPAIETLGANTVLCVDKTGTLTLNRMSVQKVYSRGEFFNLDHGTGGALPEKFNELIEFSLLASQTNPFDPMEQALKQLGERYRGGKGNTHERWEFIQEYPLSKKLLALSRVWKSPDAGDLTVASKGAPEAIMNMCRLGKDETAAMSKQVDVMAGEGLRVLGVARASYKEGPLPGDQREFGFAFLGLLGFADPIRPTVPAAIEECRKAGIRVVMITGDYPVTAQHIAREAGLQSPENLITGAELTSMSDEQLKERIKKVNVYARVVPEQKLRLVNAFKANGEIVSMTGDGVNDAPALKAANIGIAMGGRGTDVAREAAALVLLDDDFSSIVKAVRLGRRIFDNLRKAMVYILAVHVPIAGLSLIPVLLGWPLVLMPVHVVFLELIIDPACSIAFEAEPEEPDVMVRPPRDRNEPLFSRKTVLVSLLQGAAVLAATTALYGIALARGQGDMEARALAFTTMVIGNLGLIFSNRAWSKSLLGGLRDKNTPLIFITVFAFLFLGVVLYVPFARDLFKFGFLHPTDLGLALGAGVLCVAWFEAVKYLSRPGKSGVR